MAPSETEDTTDMKALRRENPSAWLEVTDNQTTPLIIDALLDSPPGREFNKKELGDHAGLSRESVRNHIDKLLKFGLIEEVPDTEPQRYRLNDNGIATSALFKFNSALNEAGSEDGRDVDEEAIQEAEEEFSLDMNFPDEEKAGDLDIPVEG